jgi:hypothetical protein
MYTGVLDIMAAAAAAAAVEAMLEIPEALVMLVVPQAQLQLMLCL